MWYGDAAARVEWFPQLRSLASLTPLLPHVFFSANTSAYLRTRQRFANHPLISCVFQQYFLFHFLTEIWRESEEEQESQAW